MPEGDAVRRLADTFEEVFVGHRLQVTSPQGRFASSATTLDGWVLSAARVVGKHMFLGFTPPSSVKDSIDEGGANTPQIATDISVIDHWVHIHLGLYGWWRFNGDSSVMDEGHGVVHRVGPKDSHRAERWGTGPLNPADGDNVAPVASGVPAETHGDEQWDAPDPIGQVRLRLLADHAVADLAGPNTCALITTEERLAVEKRLGPDPLAPGARDNAEMRSRFIANMRGRKRAIGELIMDQSLIAGVGNIYRADALFLAGISPLRIGSRISEKRLGELWGLICDLMNRGLAAGYLITMDPEEAPQPPIDGDEEASRWYVYHRTGRPCLRCGTAISEKQMQGRRLFWCSNCQR
ncbi:MAG: zinc finger domain-containing protein [Actinomycetaceae bacterium]|nr:zinc finger domain-containing protein [Actinomycetaceae bacterium]